MAKTYYIVNPKGIIHITTREIATWRLRSPGWRVPTGAEMKEYKKQKKAAQDGYKQDVDGKRLAGKRFVQSPKNLIAKPFETDIDKAMEEAEAALDEIEDEEQAFLDEVPEEVEAEEAEEEEAE